MSASGILGKAPARARAAVAGRPRPSGNNGRNGAPAADKWVTFLGSEFVAAGNVALSIASVATYSVARGSTITAGHSLYNFVWLAIYSGLLYFAKKIPYLQKSPLIAGILEILIVSSIIYFFTMGWADKAAAEKANIADNLKTEADSTRCLSDTGSCAKQKCIKETGSTVSGSTRKGEIVPCT